MDVYDHHTDEESTRNYPLTWMGRGALAALYCLTIAMAGYGIACALSSAQWN